MTLNQGYSYRYVIGPERLDLSVLSFLAEHFSHSTETEWQARLDAGEVLLDGRLVHGPERLSAGDVLVWNRPGWIEQDTPQHYGRIYQDKDLLVVDKPSGLPTIPGAGFFLNTLLSRVQIDFPQARPLHRLGRATSGLVLFALNAESASTISRNWSRVQKQYRGLSSFVASKDRFEIETPIGEEHHPRLGRVFAANANGKYARSVAKVVERRVDTTLFDVDLHTGRPHQIRIHLASIGHPLLGDPLYDLGGQPKSDQPGLPGDAGYWLHAERLILEHPCSGQILNLSAPLPEILCVIQ